MPTETVHRTVLVAGATGRLGVLVEVLLGRGHAVRAMTRQLGSPAAESLRRLGADVVYGDFDDPGSIVRAADGADAIFATGTAHKAGPEGELRHGRNLATAAAAVEVPHLVYGSGDGAATNSPVPLFRVKYLVEEHIRSLAIAHTILAPVYFMENLFNPWNLPALRAGLLPSPIPIDSAMQQVTIRDLAALTAIVIEQPDRFAGERIAIASDQLSANEAADVLSRIVGRGFKAKQTSASQLTPGLRALFDWLERYGHHVDIPALHRRYPDVDWHSYEAWMRSQSSRVRDLCPHPHAIAKY
jgi:uncharacterized protein YbjT (DUF2867 family)